jgi:ferrous-iron efflux pump FieF
MAARCPPESGGVLSEGADSRLRRMAASASLSLAVLLAVAKFAAAIVTGSLAVLASMIDSLGDIAASAITYTSVRIAQRPPDRGHRFGHGKAESLSALAQAAIVAGSAAYVLLDGMRRLASPRPVEESGLGIAVMLVAIAATIGLVLFQRRVVRLTGSQAIAADSLHYTADLATNLAVIASLLLTARLGLVWIDTLVAAAIAVYLLRHAYRIAQDAIDVLMDHELPTPERERIRALVLAHPEVQGMHDLRTRLAGGTRFMELHVELDGAMTLSAAHDVTDAIEEELRAAFPDAEIIIHQEPAGLEDARLDHRIVPPAPAPAPEG